MFRVRVEDVSEWAADLTDEINQGNCMALIYCCGMAHLCHSVKCAPCGHADEEALERLLQKMKDIVASYDQTAQMAEAGQARGTEQIVLRAKLSEPPFKAGQINAEAYRALTGEDTTGLEQSSA